jgi:CheY-like chemotaxis protein
MKKYQILLVEDNEGDVLLTREAFSECAVANEIDVVNDVDEAIRYVEKKAST